MQKGYTSGYTGYITPSEWRWLSVMGSALVLVALLPFLWVVIRGDPQQQFMGALHDYPSASANLAKIAQGARGEWLGRYLHTPEPHDGVLIDWLYVLLGQISRFMSLPPIIIFHVARVGASIFLYTALYYLAATIWMRTRTRRLFFLLAVCGSGLGWLFAPLTQYTGFLDLRFAPPYPFFTTLMNVHLPLTLGCLALMVAAMIEVLRPGMSDSPKVTNQGLMLFILSLLVSLLYPIGMVPILIAFFGILLARSIRKRHMSRQTLRWMLWFGVPALPLVAYYVSIFLYNPVVARIWILEYEITPPWLGVFIISLGVPLVIALPGLIRAIRKFEPDGNQLMLLWLLTMVLLVYFAPIIHTHFAFGLMIPIAYFGARASEDFWYTYLNRVWRYRVVVALIPLIGLSHLYALFIPVTPISDSLPQTNSASLLPRDYREVFEWLGALRTDRFAVVLASPDVGVWLPAWTGLRAVYGFPTETLGANLKREAIAAWYSATNPNECMALLNGAFSVSEPYRVKYVIFGQRERALQQRASQGNSAEPSVCLSLLTPVVSSGQVTVYLYPTTPDSAR